MQYKFDTSFNLPHPPLSTPQHNSNQLYNTNQTNNQPFSPHPQTKTNQPQFKFDTSFNLPHSPLPPLTQPNTTNQTTTTPQFKFDTSFNLPHPPLPPLSVNTNNANNQPNSQPTTTPQFKFDTSFNLPHPPLPPLSTTTNQPTTPQYKFDTSFSLPHSPLPTTNTTSNNNQQPTTPQFKFDTSFNLSHPPLPSPTLSTVSLSSTTLSTVPLPPPKLPVEDLLHTNVSVLDGIIVKTVSGHDVILSDLWKEKRVLLCVFRRFGCVICREAAYRMSALKDRLERMNVRLVGVGFEPEETQEFLSLYWKGELYIDEHRTVYKALGVKKFSPREAVMKFFSTANSEALLRVYQQGVSGNFRGDGLQSGGTFVLGPSPNGILYEHRQEYYGDLPDEEEILRHCAKPVFTFGVYNYE